MADVGGDPELPSSVKALRFEIPVREVSTGHWGRAASWRAVLLRARLRPALADALIARSGIDHGVPLVTRDADFAPFARLGGLELAP